MYVGVNLGAFAAVGAAARWGAVTVADLSGLARRHPLAGVSLAFAMLCLAGLPPGVVGLVAKVVVFQSAVDGGLVWLAVVMAVNVAIGLVYYLRVIAVLLRPADDETVPTGLVTRPVQVVLGLTLAAAAILSVLPGPLLDAVYQ
jgi:NADH-quinone oxidoreductase subunit N